MQVSTQRCGKRKLYWIFLYGISGLTISLLGLSIPLVIVSYGSWIIELNLFLQ